MRKQLTLRFTLLSTWLILAFSTLFIAGLGPNVLASPANNDGNSVQLGNEVLVPKGTVNRGDAVAIFDDVNVQGEVIGNAVAIGGDVRVDGKVSGDVVSVGGHVILGDNALVTGEVTVVGAGLERAPGARIDGSINNVGVGDFLRHPRINFAGWRWYNGLGNPVGYLFYLAGLYALSLLIISLFPTHVANVGQVLEQDWGRNAMIGALTLLLIGPASLLIAVTVIGIPVAMLLWVAFFAAKMLGYVAFVTLLGTRIARGNMEPNHLAQLGVGVLVLGLIRYVPFIGPLASVVVTILTLGAVMDSRFGTNKPWLPPRRPA